MQSSHPQTTPSTSPSPAAPTISQLATKITVAPPTNDSGYSLIWHGTFDVDASGVLINGSGVHPGSAQDWSLKYVASSSDPEWQMPNAFPYGVIYNYATMPLS